MSWRLRATTGSRVGAAAAGVANRPSATRRAGFALGCLSLLAATTSDAASEPVALLSREGREAAVPGNVEPRSADDSGAEAGRGWFWGVSGGVESVSGLPPASLKFDRPLFGGEPGELDTRYPRSSAAAWEASIGYNLQRRAALAVTLSTSSHGMVVDVDAALPHPFFFDRPRSVEGTVEVDRKQRSLHVSAMWRLLEGGKTEIALFGGPTWLQFDQEVVIGVDSDSEYPYDEASLTGPEVQTESRTATGVHAGAEVAHWFRPSSGLMGTVRYVHAPEELGLPDGARLDFDPGGVQVLIGIRFRF